MAPISSAKPTVAGTTLLRMSIRTWILRLMPRLAVSMTLKIMQKVAIS